MEKEEIEKEIKEERKKGWGHGTYFNASKVYKLVQEIKQKGAKNKTWQRN